MSCNRCRNYSTCERCERCERKQECGCGHHCWQKPEPQPCPYPPYPPFPPFPPIIPQPPIGGGGIGGYSAFAVPTAAQIQVFNQALSGSVGATYTPLLVATQIVNGTNYLFIAQQTVTNGTQTYNKLVLVSIYQALDGTVTLNSIKPLF